MLRADDDAPAGRASRAATSAANVEVEAVSSMCPCQPRAGRAAGPASRAVSSSSSVQRRRGAPEEADLVERRGEQLGEDAGLGGGVGEVGEEARVLPVRDARQEDLVEVAQHRRERLRLLGRRSGQLRADLARLRPAPAPAARRRARGTPAAHSSAAAPSSRKAHRASLLDLRPSTRARVDDLVAASARLGGPGRRRARRSRATRPVGVGRDGDRARRARPRAAHGRRACRAGRAAS